MPVRFNLSELSRHRSAKLALASLIAVGVIALVTFIAQVWRDKNNSAANQGGAAAQPTPNKPNKINTIDSIRFTVTRTGIIPAEVEVREGNFFLQIDSLIGKDNPNYVIAKERRPPKEIKAARGSRRLREVISLSPGDYVISVVGEPQLRSLLKVIRK